MLSINLSELLENPLALLAFILLIPFALGVSWFIPFPGAPSGYDWWLHFRKMERIRSIEKRARALNIGTLLPDPDSEEDRFFANCSKYEMVRELWLLSKQYKDAYTLTENFWHEMRYLRAQGSTFRTVDKDQDTYVGYRGDHPGDTIEAEGKRKAKASKTDLYVNVVEFDPIPSQAGAEDPPPIEEDAT